ncbi:META domain-containing protein [Rhodobacter sp. 24-YEA-8]|uniref:META domain-containing protein n=1 Tax=Rhodobacter sp. 24-YEA-8 TaxID=1884310 RepID=UPI00089532E6|nr:META domain-containing protein [Rhodobacter sp. 24-YEA-8]SEB45919.1 Heat shock protein HslJ [Rhodobacter sp. 24-YEA-8]
MRRSTALSLALATTLACAAGAARSAETISGGEWLVIAQDGVRVSYEASFAIDADGQISGKAPCNRYFGPNQAELPALALTAIASTRMACDRMADEHAYLTALGAMTGAEIRGETLVLTGPDDSSLEFSRDPGSKSLVCDTCGG